MAKPFFKWPGSKSWLLAHLSAALPPESVRVVEPFSGSAAFYLGTNYHRALLADTNEKVVGCLIAVRDRPKKVLQYLSRLTNSLEDYVRVRDENPRSEAAAAGRLIFLTNTSWGGLYRENLRGKFNVPFGNNGRAFYCEETILAAAEKLREAEIRHSTFGDTLAASRSRDLLFIDAPYVTKNASEYFDRYHASKFNWNDQLALASLLVGKKLKSRMMLITCAADRDLYQLFRGWTVFEFSKRNSMTAHTNRAGYRREALLISPALLGLSNELARDRLFHCV